MVKNSRLTGSEVYFLSVYAIFQPPFPPVVLYTRQFQNRSLDWLIYLYSRLFAECRRPFRLALNTESSPNNYLARLTGQRYIFLLEKLSAPYWNTFINNHKCLLKGPRIHNEITYATTNFASMLLLPFCFIVNQSYFNNLPDLS